MNERLDNMRKKYESIPVPEELDLVVKRAIKKRKNRRMRLQSLAGGAAASILLFTIVNTSPAFAAAISEVPVLGSIVKVITINEYTRKDESSEANIQTPAITNLDHPELEQTLNSKYAEENKKLYEAFEDEVKELEKKGKANMSLDSGYEIVTNTDRLLTLSRYVTTSAGSSGETITFDTIDKQEKIVITLPSLFKDDSYVQVISNEIKQQMKKQMQEDPGKVYWLNEEDSMTPFESISKDQSFYINANGKLVISFNEYEVAPGSMGLVEFIIPTETISDILTSHEYIK